MNSKPSVLKPRIKKRVRIILVSLFLFLVFLSVNILRLDLFLYSEYRKKTLSEITTTSVLRAERGKIYDSNMNILADSNTVWRIFVSTRDIKAAEKKNKTDYCRIIADGIAPILSLDRNQLYNKIKRHCLSGRHAQALWRGRARDCKPRAYRGDLVHHL